MGIRRRNNFSGRMGRRNAQNPAGQSMTVFILKISAFSGVLLFLLIAFIRFEEHHEHQSQGSRLGNPYQTNQRPELPNPKASRLYYPTTHPDEPPLILDDFKPSDLPVPTAKQAQHVTASSGDVCAPPPNGELVRGTMRPDSIVTLVSVPKTPTIGENSGGEVAERHIMFGWSQMKKVDFLIMSSNCQVLRLAAEYGLPTVYVSSGSDTEDLTYRHILNVVRSVARTPYVGFTNGDIAYDETLVETLQAAQDWPERNGMPMTFIGRRANANIPLALFGQPDQPITVERWNIILTHMQQTNEVFIDAAQDYFIFSRDLPLNLDALVPFLLGGIAFDNYIATKFWELHGAGAAYSIDATETINALHMNHGQKNELKLSHTNLASKFNAMLVKELVIHDKKLKKRDRHHKIGIHHGYTSHTQMQSVRSRSFGSAERVSINFVTRDKIRTGSISAPPSERGILKTAAESSRYDIDPPKNDNVEAEEALRRDETPGTSMDASTWIAQRKADQD